MTPVRTILGWISLFAIIILFSCQHEEELPLFDPSAELVLNTDWRYNTNYSGLLTDPSTGEELIYSGDVVTYAKVRVFDNSGRFLWDIPLDSVFDHLDDIKCLTLLSRDSLFILDGRGENYFVLDAAGRVVRQRVLIHDRCDEQGDKYELYPTNTGLTRLGGKFYFGPALLGRCDGSELYERSDEQWVDAQRYHDLFNRRYKIASLDPRIGKGGVAFGASGILEHLVDTPRNTLGMAKTSTGNGKLFLFSDYAAYVHEIDTIDLSVSHKIPISYVNGAVGITPPPISEEDENKDGANLPRSIMSYILSFTYDHHSGKYLATVCHEVPETTPEVDRSWRRNWSLIILDEQFDKTGEHVLSGKEFSGSVLLGMNSGTWVLERDPDPQGFKHPKVFRKLNIQ